MGATLNNLSSSSNSGNSTLLDSHDLSAAFISIGHAILLNQLETSFGFDGLVYDCFLVVVVVVDDSHGTFFYYEIPEAQQLFLH